MGQNYILFRGKLQILGRIENWGEKEKKLLKIFATKICERCLEFCLGNISCRSGFRLILVMVLGLLVKGEARCALG